MDDKKTRGNKKMRSAAVREEMMGMMRSGEAPKDMKERLDKVGRESDNEYRRETRGMGMNYGGKVKMACGGMHKKKMKSGGAVKKGCDGLAKKGKTKGRMC